VPDGALKLVGGGMQVPVLPSGSVPYTNLDFAASAPALQVVQAAVEEFLPWYSSVHRGAGFKSRVATAAYEGARDSIGRFVGAREGDEVVITRHTTDALNLMARALPADAEVIVFAWEHHANLLPWRALRLRQLPIPNSADELLDSLGSALASRPAALVSVTGASNVTGEVPPLRDIADLAHLHGARLLVDAAQLAPHRRIDMNADDIDYLALSGHKLYAPYGAGALVGRRDWLDAGPPYLAGGGAIEFVSLDDVVWSTGPERHEAGSPNVIGAIALAAACETLSAFGMERIAEHERSLIDCARGMLLQVPGLELYSTWPINEPHIGVLTFNLASMHHSLVANVLSAEHGVGVRDGCFCAHPLILHTLDLGPADAERLMTDIRAGHKANMPGLVRASFGLESTVGDVDRLADALNELAERGPRWTYRLDESGQAYEPDPDPRPRPRLPAVRLAF
jgi:selenocysteine lyase/cysteine desulfurase